MKTAILTIIMFVLTMVVDCPASEYQIFDLGEMFALGEDIWRPVSLNEVDQVAGTQNLGAFDIQAFLWDNEIVTYIQPDPSFITWANGINNNAFVVGAEATEFETFPFIWESGSKTHLPTLPSEIYGEAAAVNDSGNIVGFLFSDPMAPWLTVAVLWQGDVIIAIPKLNLGDTYNLTTDINNHDHIVGYSGQSDAKYAFLYQDTQLTAIGALSGDIWSVAEAINDATEVVGYSIGETGLKHAFLWQNEAVSPLPDDSTDETWALGINNQQQIVGAYSSAGETRACLWQNDAMIDLNSLVPEGESWILTEAHDINDSAGIVGVGINPQGEPFHGFLMILLPATNTPPVADAGEDQTVTASPDGTAQVILDGTGSYDPDGDDLTYAWFLNGGEIATGATATIELSSGQYTIELIVNDGMADSDLDEVVIEVITAPVFETELRMQPKVVNRTSGMKKLLALVTVTGILESDIDPTVLLSLDPGGTPAQNQKIISQKDRVIIQVSFNKDDVLAGITGKGLVEITVTGQLTSGQSFSAEDTIKIIAPRSRP